MANANHDRSSTLFTELLALMIARAHRGLRRSLAETITRLKIQYPP